MDEDKNPFSAEDEAIKTAKALEDKDNPLTGYKDKEENKEVEETQEVSSDEKYEELNNKYLRLAADFDNFRKRTAVEKQEKATG